MAKRYEDRYGRGGFRTDRDHAHDRGYSDRHDRGYVDRATDEVRSWFGDDDAERRRRFDEERDRASRASGLHDHGDWGPPRDRGDARAWRPRDESYDRRSDSDWNRSSDRPGSPSAWRDEPPYPAARDDRWRDRPPAAPHRAWEDRGTWAGRADELGDSRWRTQPSNLERGYESSHDGRSRGSGETDRARGTAHWGRGPRGYQRSDTRIQEDVCDRLTYADVDAENIEVSVANGEVTLGGHVHDRWDKRRAEDLAEDVPGVREVHNNIRVQRGDRGLGMSETSSSNQPGAVLGVNPTSTSTIGTPPKRS